MGWRWRGGSSEASDQNRLAPRPLATATEQELDAMKQQLASVQLALEQLAAKLDTDK